MFAIYPNSIPITKNTPLLSKSKTDVAILTNPVPIITTDSKTFRSGHLSHTFLLDWRKIQQQGVFFGKNKAIEQLGTIATLAPLLEALIPLKQNLITYCLQAEHNPVQKDTYVSKQIEVALTLVSETPVLQSLVSAYFSDYHHKAATWNMLNESKLLKKFIATIERTLSQVQPQEEKVRDNLISFSKGLTLKLIASQSIPDEADYVIPARLINQNKQAIQHIIAHWETENTGKKLAAMTLEQLQKKHPNKLPETINQNDCFKVASIGKNNHAIKLTFNIPNSSGLTELDIKTAFVHTLYWVLNTTVGEETIQQFIRSAG